MIVNINDKWRLRRYDSRNWTIDEMRTPNPNNNFVKINNSSLEPHWINRGVYFQTLEYGLRWCYEHELLSDENADIETDLKGALDEARRIATSLTEKISIAQNETDDVELVDD